MRRSSVLLALSAVAGSVAWPAPLHQSATAPTAVSAAPPERAVAAAGLADLRFVPNLGQWDAEVRYAVVGDVAAWTHDDGFTLRLMRTPGHRDGAELASGARATQSGGVLRTRFSGAASATIAGDRVPGEFNFLIGADPDRWRTAVPAYAAVTLQQVMPGIDVVLRRRGAAANRLEYDLVLAPGADLAALAVRCEGAESVHVGDDGRLCVRVPTPDGIVDLVQDPPIAWQETPTGRSPLAVAFRALGVDRYGFVAPGLDPGFAAVVDPSIAWSTFLGGGATDSVNDLVYRPGQGIWLGGWAGSTDFPTTVGAYHTTGQVDAFVARLNETGTALQFATYFGGSGFDEVRGIDVGSNGAVTLAGLTDSTNLPVSAGAYQAAMAGGSPLFPLGDAFVARLSPTGGAVQACTYLGGTWDDAAEAVAVDAQGNTFVAGWTSSFNFPTTAGSWQPALGGPLTLQTDGFVARLLPSMQTASYCTYVGGTLNDQFYGLALDPATDEAVAVGWSWSADFPVTSLAFATTSGGDMDAIAVRLSASGASAVYSTYLGGIDEDLAHEVALGADGSAWIAGWTRSSNYPVSPNAPQTQPGGDRDATVSHLSANGQALVFSTRLGGPRGDQARGISVQGTDVMVVGEAGDGFPLTQDAHQPVFAQGALDGFMTLLGSGGPSLVYSSYAGGGDIDVLDQVVLGANGLAVIGGWSFAADFPVTQGVVQTQHRGDEDGVVLMLDLLTDLGGGMATNPLGDPAVRVVGAGEHELLATRLANSTPRPVTVEGLRLFVAGQGSAPSHLRDVTVWVDDPGTPGDRDVVVGGPVALAGDDAETPIALQGLVVPPGGEAIVRVFGDFDAVTSGGTVEIAAIVPGPQSWSLRAEGAGSGPVVRVLGDGRAGGSVLVAGALPGDADGDGGYTVFDLRALCNRLGAVDAVLDADGDQVLSPADVALVRSAVFEQATAVDVPVVADRGAWIRVGGVFPALGSVEASLGGRSLVVGALTPRQLTLFVSAGQAAGMQDLVLGIDGKAVVTRTVLVQ